MLITIDNFDGLGPLDYSGAVAAEGRITVQRALNAPSRCTAEVVLGMAGLPLPVRRAKVTVSADAGAILFTGYLATEPVRIYAGESTRGSVYRARISAVSEEWLLDNQGSGGNVSSASSFGLSGEALVARLAARAQVGNTAALPVIAGAGVALSTGAFTPQSNLPWSKNAGVAASAAYAGYRAINGQILLQPAASVTHAFSDADGTLAIAELQTSAIRDLANDVTVSGAEEATAYIEESFLGDGVTTVFNTSGSPFRDSNRTLLLDAFNAASFDVSQWNISDPGNHVSLSSLGLTMTGGNGSDGQTTVSAIDVVEMGGVVLAQLGGVLLSAASDGMLAGMYQGTSVLANCFAGFRVRQSSGSTIIVPVVNGVEAGTVFTPLAGHRYTLRLRLHCVETQRVMQRYYCMPDGVVQSFGSLSGVPAPMDLVFDLVDEGAASNTPATVLYDSAAAGTSLSSSPATCVFVVANATQMFGSVASVSVTRPGTMWVVSTLPGGSKQTRLTGIAGQGVDCLADYGTQSGTPGKLTFFAGKVPIAGERITVFYRNQQRAIARMQSTSSIATEALSGTPGTSRWLGKVLQPVARSSVDCESAAQAVLAIATSRTAAIAGTYALANPAADIWPGDVLAITSGGVTSSFLIRSAVLNDAGTQPEIRHYQLQFANDWATEWADGIGLKLNEEIAPEAILPPNAESAPNQALVSLQQLLVTNVTSSTLQIDTGTDAPAGGGFEVRRADWQFGAFADPVDLVLRSPVRAFSIPRAAQVERFYIRMFNAGTPRLYSRFSSAVLLNVPVS